MSDKVALFCHPLIACSPFKRPPGKCLDKHCMKAVENNWKLTNKYSLQTMQLNCVLAISLLYPDSGISMDKNIV